MTTAPLEALHRVLASDGAGPKRLRELTASLLAGEVVRLPDDPRLRLGSDWAFLDRHRDAVAEYVSVAGFRLLVDEEYHFAFLVHPEPRLREVLDKATSRVAVACRLLYHQAQQTVRLTAGVDVTMRRLLEYLDVSNGTGARTPRVKTIEALRHLARYDMITLPPRFSGADDDTFAITPVLAHRLPLSAIQSYLQRTHAGRSEATGSDGTPVPPTGDISTVATSDERVECDSEVQAPPPA